MQHPQRTNYRRDSSGLTTHYFITMNKNPLNKGILTENAVGIGTVTRGMVQERAVELAVINGRSAQDPSESLIGNRPNVN